MISSCCLLVHCNSQCVHVWQILWDRTRAKPAYLRPQRMVAASASQLWEERRSPVERWTVCKSSEKRIAPSYPIPLWSLQSIEVREVRSDNFRCDFYNVGIGVRHNPTRYLFLSETASEMLTFLDFIMYVKCERANRSKYTETETKTDHICMSEFQ